MQIVIDVSEEEYDAIKSGHSVFVTAQRGGGKSLTIDLIKTVANGTPLPKGHGRLIDADIVVDDIDTERVNLFMDGLKGTPRGYEHLNDLQRIMDEIPTIIEADKETSFDQEGGDDR